MICKDCAVKGSERCPYGGEIPEAVQQYGCYHYTKPLPVFNKKGNPTRCAECRFFFRKARTELADKSFIVCGCVPSLVQRIKPVLNCPNFKPIRRKIKARIEKSKKNR